MNSSEYQIGIRSNFVGDMPEIDPSAFVDPSAQIMGNVHIGPNVYVGPLTVVRADEPDREGKVHPVIIEDGSFVQDGVIIHARAGTSVKIGPRANIAHGVIIHGPCMIGEGCFVALRATLYNSIIEDSVWVGIGSILMRTTVPSHTISHHDPGRYGGSFKQRPPKFQTHQCQRGGVSEERLRSERSPERWV
jgi:carbonic anhydrase/acetyltransferase-like protein (isoleucine patch superfamily)